MKRQLTLTLVAAIVLGVRRRPSSRSVPRVARSRPHAAAPASSGNTASWQGQRATGTQTVSQTGDGYNVNKQVQTQSGASKSVDKDINVEDKSVDRLVHRDQPWGQSASRDREVQGQGGYATIEGARAPAPGATPPENAQPTATPTASPWSPAA